MRDGHTCTARSLALRRARGGEDAAREDGAPTASPQRERAAPQSPDWAGAGDALAWRRAEDTTEDLALKDAENAALYAPPRPAPPRPALRSQRPRGALPAARRVHASGRTRREGRGVSD